MISYALANNGIRKGVNMEYCINGRAIYTLANAIETLSKFTFREKIEKDKSFSLLTHGLPSIAAYLFIPYGQDELDYVKEKIDPLSIETFLHQRVECLLEKTNILNTPRYQELIQPAFEYCKNFTQKELPFHPISVTMLATRLESELNKYFTFMNYSTPKNVLDADSKFLEYKLRYFYNLKENEFPSINFDFHLEQVMKEYPFHKSFELTDTYRNEIDNLPIFTFLSP